MSQQHHHQHQHQHGHHHHQHHHQMQGSGEKWQKRHPNYASIDSGPQTFFYTLSNMLKLSEAKNILEVGCGAGKLLSTVLDLKNPQATYIATDKSEAMVKEAKNRLQAHFAKYESKLTYEEWLCKQHMLFEVQDGESIQVKEPTQFDRIIANMVLCHADDPLKMLKNWHSLAAEGCLLGVSLLGDPQKNNFVRGMREAIVEAGEKLPEGNPPYHWYDKISKIVEQSGWQIILEWDQNGLFPYLTLEEFKQKPLGHNKMGEKVKEIFEEKVLSKYLLKEKSGVQFWSKVIIARKRVVN